MNSNITKMTKETTVFDCTLVTLEKNHQEKGNLTVVTNNHNIPFEVKRVYYLYDIPGGEERGAHAHKELQQLIFALSGSFDITVDDGKSKRTIFLSRPNIGLLMPPGLWRELNNFSSGSICVVLASQEYSESDYIRDYQEFKAYKK